MNLDVDFPLILTLLVLVTGLVSLMDLLFFAKKRKVAGTKQPWPFEYARSFFPLLLLVLLIRSFLIQPYRVPTGSLEPTVMPGDFIAVNQFAYGLHLPVLHTKILNVGEPKVGDIVLFRWPVDPRITYVKRIIGVPRDHVVYKNKVLYINGKEMPQKFLKNAFDVQPTQNIPVELKSEDLQGVRHDILVRSQGGETRDFNIVVPKNNYFVMGDNRDDSGDSRMWGFVPEKNLIGKAFIVWMSWNPFTKNWRDKIRWQRIGTRL